MKRSIEQLGEVCEALDKGESSWRFLADASPSDAAHGIEEEIAALLTKEGVSDNSLPETDLEPALSLLELAAVQFTDLGIICYERSGSDDSLLWPGKPIKKGTFVLEVLAVSLANTLLAVRHLVLEGFDQQARVLVRYFVELADVTVAIAYDYDFFVKYANAEQEYGQAYKYWREHLSPKKVRDLLDRFDDETGAPEEIKKTARDVRQNTYQWLSAYSHAHILSQAFSILAPYTGENDALIPRFGGFRDESSKQTLRKAVIYAWQTSLQLGYLLASRDHDWYAFEKKKDRERAWFFYRREVFTRLFLRHYKALIKPTEEDPLPDNSTATA